LLLRVLAHVCLQTTKHMYRGRLRQVNYYMIAMLMHKENQTVPAYEE